MYSFDDTTISTALLGVFVISLLLVASIASGSVAASTASTASTPSLGDSTNQVDQTQNQEWCLKFMSQGVNSDLPDDISCNALSDISPHQQIGIDYSVQNYGKYQYVVLTAQSNASQPAQANITIQKDGEVLASYRDANQSLGFVQERHYNLLTREINTDDPESDGVSGPVNNTLHNIYTQDERETILKANLSDQEITNLRMYKLSLNSDGAIKSVMAQYKYTSDDFNSQTEEFEYKITMEVTSRDRVVADTQFTVSRVLQRSVINEEPPGTSDGTGGGVNTTDDPSSNTQVTQVIQSGFDVTLNETVISDISRYSDGTSRISALQDPRVPPNAGGSNAAVGQANNMSNLRENSTKYPAVVFGDNTEDMLHIGTSYYGVPQAENHYLVLTYGLQGEANTEAEVQIVTRQGEVIDPDARGQNPRPFILNETMNDSLNLQDREQFQKAVEDGTTNSRQVVIRLTEEEVEYINDNYEAFVTYRTDGGEDTLLLYDAHIASTDVVRSSTKLPEGSTNNNTSEYADKPATFNVSYRMPYSLNAQYNQIDVLPGETFKLPVTVQNHGDTRVERTIGLHDQYRENHMNYSTIVAERTVTVPPQSEKTIFIKHTWEDYQHGNHTLTLYDTTDSTNWKTVNSQEGAKQYDVYVYQPPTFQVVGMNAPNAWLRYDHFQTLVAVQNVGDLDSSFLPEDQQPYIQGKFGTWQGSISGYVSGGNVRAGEGGGTVNLYFKRNIDYTPDYPNPNQYYDNNTWRQNAPYHTELSNATFENNDTKKGPFPITVEAVHPWAVIDGQNTVTDTPHTDYVTYRQMEAPQVVDNETVYQTATPDDAPFVDYTKNNNREQRDMFIYQNELRNCHLAGNHTSYNTNVSSDWDEQEVVDHCRGLMRDNVSIYELRMSTVRARNKNDSMVERRWNDDWEKETPNPGLYYASPWPYTETDPSTFKHSGTYQNIQEQQLRDHYSDIPEWSINGYAAETRLDTNEINSILEQYETGDITYDELNKLLLSDQAYADWKNGNGQPALTDKQLERATSCDGSTTSQLENTGTPPNCQGFGLETQQMPTTAVENIHPPVETEEGHKYYVDVHIVNNGTASAGYARIKIVTNKTGTGLNNTTVVGHGVARIPPNSDRIFRVPVVLPNEPGVEGHHDLQVRVRTEPDYTSYRVNGWNYSEASGRFGVDFYAETWEDFVFQNMSTTETTYKDINQVCEGIGTGECENQGEQTTFTQFTYTNFGGEAGNHTIQGTYGFWATPTGDGSDWPTLHHQQKTQYWDDTAYGFEEEYWLSGTPSSGDWVGPNGTLQKNPEQNYAPYETERWVMQTQLKEPGIYRAYVTQERVNNEDTNGTLEQYENQTVSMWGIGSDYSSGVGSSASVNTYTNESHWVQFRVYDIKSPVSRFYYEAENFPRTHSATSYDDSRNGNVVIWEGGTAHFDGRERLDWTAQEFESGIAQDMNVSSDNVGIDVYDWTFTGGDARVYQQAHDNRAGNPTEGKTSRRFNQSGTYDVTLQVWDYPQYTSGGNNSNPNTNISTQTVEVKNDDTKPSVQTSHTGQDQNYDVNNDVVWSGSPVDRSTQFTNVNFEVAVDDNAIGLECGGTLDDGSSIDFCGWEKTDGTWNGVNHGSVVESAVWSATLYYDTQQNSEECVTFYAHDFSHNRNESTTCVTVHEDTTEPTADYTSDTSWVWADYEHADTNLYVTYDASGSYDNGNPAVGLHGEPYSHTVNGGAWQSSATETTSYGYSSSPTRTETETVTVRDWYGNSVAPESEESVSTTVYSDHSDPLGTGDTRFEDYSYNEKSSASETETVCPDNVNDVGVNGGIGIYDNGCTDLTVYFNFDTSTDSTEWRDTGDSCGNNGDLYREYELWSDTDSDTASTQTTIEDKHGNTNTVTVKLDGDGSSSGDRATDNYDCRNEDNTTCSSCTKSISEVSVLETNEAALPQEPTTGDTLNLQIDVAEEIEVSREVNFGTTHNGPPIG